MFFMLTVGSSQASPFRFSGTTGYDQTKDQGQQDFYTQTYGATFDRQVNQAISYNADVRYTSSWHEEGEKQEFLAPSLRLALANDFFNLGLSGAATEKMTQSTADASDRFWEGTFASRWHKRFVPEIRASYGLRNEFDDNVPRGVDSDTAYTDAQVEWDLALARITYNYHLQDRTDDVGLTEDQNSNHFVRLDTSGSFLDDRLRVNLTQSYTDDTAEYSAVGNHLIKLTLNQTLAVNDSTPANNSDNPLILTPALADGNTTVNALTVNSGDSMNIALQADLAFFPQIDMIYLYTDVDITTTTANNFTWALYSNADPSITPTWTPETGFTSVYNPTERRFEFSIPAGIQRRFVKLVTTATPTTPAAVNFSEIEAYHDFKTSSGTAFSTKNRSNSKKTDFGFNYRLSSDLTLAYTLYLEYRDLSNDTSSESSSHTGSLNWKANRYFDCTLRSSFNNQDDGQGSETSGRTYALDVSSPLLDTVNLNYGVVRSEAYSGGEKYQTSEGYNLSSDAQLYEDLSSSLDMYYSKSKQLRTGDRTKTFDSLLQLTSRLTPKFTVNLTGGYNNSRGSSNTEAVSAALNFNWRASDLLLLQGNGNQKWQSDSADQKGADFKIVLALTPKTQLDLLYGVTESDSTSHNAGLNLRWNINKLLGAELNSGYQLNNGTDVESWNVSVRITAALGSS